MDNKEFAKKFEERTKKFAIKIIVTNQCLEFGVP
jgi:hypothetical protein